MADTLEHINAVAKRQGEKLKSGYSENAVRKYLIWCGWEQPELDTIIKKAKRYANGRTENED